MGLQSSGQITLGQIAAEFGGSAPHAASEYYGKGNAPGSGQMRLAQSFYGTSNFSYQALDYGGIRSEGASTFNYGTKNFGTADSSRIIVVIGNTSYGTAGVSSVSIGGSNGTLHAQHSGTYSRSFLATRHVPSGTSGNVTVRFSGGSVRLGIAVYAMYGLDPSNYAPINVQKGSNGSYGRTVTTRAGGVVFATVSDADGFNGNWTGVTRNYGFAPGHGRVEMASSLTTGTSLYVRVTNTGSNRGSSLYVSF